MSARRRRDTTEQPKIVRPPEFDTCNFYVEVLNPAFDSKRVLLRRLIFIDEYRTKYVSVGFYPTQDYQLFVYFGAVKNKPTFLILTEQLVKTMAECLPRICDSICGKEQYGCKDGDFRMNTTGIYRVARLYLDKQYISLKLFDLQYLSRIFHVVQTHLNAYTLALPDVLPYVTAAKTDR